MSTPVGLVHGWAIPEDPARVVLLGGGGFIGRTLRRTLTAAGLDVLSPSRAELDLGAADAPERLAGMLKPTDAVVVLAAVTPDKGRGLGPFVSNIAMAANVCRAMERLTPAHVIYFSSDAVYPAAVGRVTEESCVQPSDLYGMMHAAREVMLRSSVPAPVAVLRPTLVYGAADTHNSYGPNRLRRMAQRERRITLFGEGEERRDHIYIDDVVDVTLRVLRCRSAGTLNVATGHSIAFAELAQAVASLFDAPIEIRGTPRQTPVTHRHFDVTAMHKAFPTFVFTPLADGLAQAHREMLETAAGG